MPLPDALAEILTRNGVDPAQVQPGAADPVAEAEREAAEIARFDTTAHLRRLRENNAPLPSDTETRQFLENAFARAFDDSRRRRGLPTWAEEQAAKPPEEPKNTVYQRHPEIAALPVGVVRGIGQIGNLLISPFTRQTLPQLDRNLEEFMAAGTARPKTFAGEVAGAIGETLPKIPFGGAAGRATGAALGLMGRASPTLAKIIAPLAPTLTAGAAAVPAVASSAPATYNALLAEGMDPDAAFRTTIGQGLVEALITAGFGQTGIEALTKPARAVPPTVWGRVRDALVVGGAPEGAEELVQAWQPLADEYARQNPGATLGDILVGSLPNTENFRTYAVSTLAGLTTGAIAGARKAPQEPTPAAVPGGAINAQDQVQEAGRLPAVQGQPAQAGPEVQTQEGTPLGQGQGPRGPVALSPAPEGGPDGAQVQGQAQAQVAPVAAPAAAPRPAPAAGRRFAEEALSDEDAVSYGILAPEVPRGASGVEAVASPEGMADEVNAVVERLQAEGSQIPQGSIIRRGRNGVVVDMPVADGPGRALVIIPRAGQELDRAMAQADPDAVFASASGRAGGIVDSQGQAVDLPRWRAMSVDDRIATLRLKRNAGKFTNLGQMVLVKAPYGPPRPVSVAAVISTRIGERGASLSEEINHYLTTDALDDTDLDLAARIVDRARERGLVPGLSTGKAADIQPTERRRSAAFVEDWFKVYQVLAGPNGARAAKRLGQAPGFFRRLLDRVRAFFDSTRRAVQAAFGERAMGLTRRVAGGEIAIPAQGRVPEGARMEAGAEPAQARAEQAALRRGAAESEKLLDARRMAEKKAAEAQREKARADREAKARVNAERREARERERADKIAREAPVREQELKNRITRAEQARDRLEVERKRLIESGIKADEAANRARREAMKAQGDLRRTQQRQPLETKAADLREKIADLRTSAAGWKQAIAEAVAEGEDTEVINAMRASKAADEAKAKKVEGALVAVKNGIDKLKRGQDLANKTFTEAMKQADALLAKEAENRFFRSLSPEQRRAYIDRANARMEVVETFGEPRAGVMLSVGEERQREAIKAALSEPVVQAATRGRGRRPENLSSLRVAGPAGALLMGYDAVTTDAEADAYAAALVQANPDEAERMAGNVRALVRDLKAKMLTGKKGDVAPTANEMLATRLALLKQADRAVDLVDTGTVEGAKRGLRLGMELAMISRLQGTALGSMLGSRQDPMRTPEQREALLLENMLAPSTAAEKKAQQASRRGDNEGAERILIASAERNAVQAMNLLRSYGLSMADARAMAREAATSPAAMLAFLSVQQKLVDNANGPGALVSVGRMLHAMTLGNLFSAATIAGNATGAAFVGTVLGGETVVRGIWNSALKAAGIKAGDTSAADAYVGTRAILRSIGAGLHNAASAFWAGKSALDTINPRQMAAAKERGSSPRDLGFFQSTTGGRIARQFLTPAINVMVALDAFIGTVSLSAGLHIQAAREARRQGITDPVEFDNFVAQTVAYDMANPTRNARVDAAFDLADQINMRQEFAPKDPTGKAEFKRIAPAFGLADKVLKGVMSSQIFGPIMSQLVPFTGTALRLGAFATEYAPGPAQVNLAKNMIAAAMGKIPWSEAGRSAAKNFIGLAALLLAMNLKDDEGEYLLQGDASTSALPSPEGQLSRRLGTERSAGGFPLFRVDPAGSIAGAVANVRDALLGVGHEKGRPAAERAGRLVEKSISHLFANRFTQPLYEVILPALSGQMGEARFERTAEGFARRLVPSEALVRQFRQVKTGERETTTQEGEFAPYKRGVLAIDPFSGETVKTDTIAAEIMGVGRQMGLPPEATAMAKKVRALQEVAGTMPGEPELRAKMFTYPQPKVTVDGVAVPLDEVGDGSAVAEYRRMVGRNFLNNARGLETLATPKDPEVAKEMLVDILDEHLKAVEEARTDIVDKYQLDMVADTELLKRAQELAKIREEIRTRKAGAATAP